MPDQDFFILWFVRVQRHLRVNYNAQLQDVKFVEGDGHSGPHPMLVTELLLAAGFVCALPLKDPLDSLDH